MVASKKIAYYEVRNANSEIVIYYRQIAPGQRIVEIVPFVQRYSGTLCLQKPHNAYVYYNNDQPVWTTSK